MSGSPRDLAVLEPWNTSLERSRARRARQAHRRTPRAALAALTPSLGPGNGTEAAVRDLSDGLHWELSLGRSRARRRAAELQFVPTGSRAKRISIGTLAALSVGPTTSLAAGEQSGGPA